VTANTPSDQNGTDANLGAGYSLGHDAAVKILNAEKDGEDGVLVRFSDGTITGYVAEELLALRPIREGVEEPRPQQQGQEPATH
jgi:hypothetical protein